MPVLQIRYFAFLAEQQDIRYARGVALRQAGRILVSYTKKGYWLALLLAEIYSFAGLFMSMSSLTKTFYPITALLGVSLCAKETWGALYQPVSTACWDGSTQADQEAAQVAEDRYGGTTPR